MDVNIYISGPGPFDDNGNLITGKVGKDLNIHEAYDAARRVGVSLLSVIKNDIGFDSDFNEVSIFYKDKNVEDEIISKTYKSVVADEIVKRVINQLNLI